LGACSIISRPEALAEMAKLLLCVNAHAGAIHTTRNENGSKAVRSAAGYHPEIAPAFNSFEFLHSTRG